jgi:hypothetical protein
MTVTTACVAAVWLFFGQMHIPLHTWPALVVTNEIHRPGFYADGTVYLRPEADCGVLAHETFHHWQFEYGGVARSPQEHLMREIGAHVFEQTFRAQDS